ncbi:hypothetical protein RFI_07364, partial [Reticulomyxa filosa]
LTLEQAKWTSRMCDRYFTLNKAYKEWFERCVRLNIIEESFSPNFDVLSESLVEKLNEYIDANDTSPDKQDKQKKKKKRDKKQQDSDDDENEEEDEDDEDEKKKKKKEEKKNKRKKKKSSDESENEHETDHHKQNKKQKKDEDEWAVFDMEDNRITNSGKANAKSTQAKTSAHGRQKDNTNENKTNKHTLASEESKERDFLGELFGTTYNNNNNSNNNNNNNNNNTQFSSNNTGKG